MNSTRPFLIIRVLLLALAMAFLGLPGGPVNAQSVQHLAIPQPGGMPGLPVMTGVARVTNGVSVTWDGPSGYYQLLQKQSLRDASWQPVGAASFLRQATITSLYSNAFFRVSGPTPQYAGAATCAECHAEVLNTVVHTAHFGAFTNLPVADQTNSSCLVCHTVGYQLPSGFSNLSATPQLAGVQCENCHGPAANHAANPIDPTAIPRVEVAATMCGGCHNTQFVPASAASYHPPYYEEWNASPHQSVLADLKADFAGGSGPSFFIPTCGRCHSGTVREAFLEGNSLPNAREASAVGIACATCHDPHQVYLYTNVLSGVITNPVTGVVVVSNGPGVATYTNQLRNPLSSVQDYHVTGDFTTNYNPAINVCAQCHNDRGASYKDKDRPPHNSPQYNILIGTTGVLDPNNPDVSHFEPASHALFITNQCVGCHMQTAPSLGPSQPPMAGHKFVVENYEACAACHGSAANGSNLVAFVSGLFTNKIQAVQGLLVQWATTKAPAILGTAEYGTRAWEYTTPGELSPGGPGPNSTLQDLIPQNIKMARLNLYLVFHDGSFGVHNPSYSLALLNTAQSMVQSELNK
jgi:Cytochrome c554 and c-prime